MSQSPPSRRLSVEQLEDRLTPAFGTPWFDGSSLTLSFVPDGTDVSGRPSDLFALMGTNATQAQWQREILRAYQTWAVEANLNVGLVADGGQAMGVAGAPQEDIRFGDIRIGARPLSAPGEPGSTLAGASGFDYASKTWAGDLVFNSLYNFGIDHVANQQNDLFSVALHEAGHSFGLADQDSDSTSALYSLYQGALSGLSASDVAAIQALYGARKADAYEGAAGNGTRATAYSLDNLIALSADVTSAGDVDVYKFTTPSSSSATGLTVKLQAAGISLLTAKLTVLDAQGNTVAGATATDPLDNNLSITIPNYQAGATYYVKVQGASSDVFSVGSYVLKLNYAGTAPSGVNADVTNAYYANAESSANNNAISGAMTLTSVRSTKANTFVVAGALTSSSDVDWYRITPTLPSAATGTLFVGTMTTTNGLLPAVAVYDAQGQLLPTVVAMNEGGSYEVQLPSATTGTTYYIRVVAADPSGTRATGSYTIGATLAPVAPTSFSQTLSDSLTTAESVQYTRMTVDGDRLTQFALSASGGSATAATAVRMTIYNSEGRAVFTVAALAGQPLATGSVWLESGSYTVVFNAATRDGSALGTLGVALGSRSLTDPIDPYPVDPLAPAPAPLEPISTTEPVATVPPDPILDPITDPFASLSGYLAMP